jgi:ribosome-associated heat shock protein Hsp15
MQSDDNRQAPDMEGGGAPVSTGGPQRLDKWLWFARVIRTRTLAAGLVTDGRVRVNGERIIKPSHAVRNGDVVTVTVGAHVRILQVVEPGERRGSATEAQALYRDLTPPREPRSPDTMGDRGSNPGQREQGSGRPTKRERRAIDRLLPDED